MDALATAEPLTAVEGSLRRLLRPASSIQATLRRPPRATAGSARPVGDHEHHPRPKAVDRCRTVARPVYDACTSFERDREVPTEATVEPLIERLRKRAGDETKDLTDGELVQAGAEEERRGGRTFGVWLDLDDDDGSAPHGVRPTEVVRLSVRRHKNDRSHHDCESDKQPEADAFAHELSRQGSTRVTRRSREGWEGALEDPVTGLFVGGVFAEPRDHTVSGSS